MKKKFYITYILMALYFYAVLIHPLIQNELDISKSFDVLKDWQTLTAGLVALLASIIGFHITLIAEEKQRQRNFIAARSFLPLCFSELIDYFKQSAKILNWVYEQIQQSARVRTEIPYQTPVLDEKSLRVIQECIMQADEFVAQKLSKIIRDIQIHNSRIVSIYQSCNENTTRIINSYEIISYIYRLSELMATINKMYGFARADEKLDLSPLDWGDYRNALLNLDLEPEDYEDLEGFIKRAIDRERKKKKSRLCYGLAHEILLDFGRSPVLPMCWWIVLLSISHWAHLTRIFGLAGKIATTSCMMDAPETPWAATSAFFLSLKQGLISLGGNSQKMEAFYTCLYGHPTKIPAWVIAWETVQMLLSVMLIYLFIKALSYQFRVK